MTGDVKPSAPNRRARARATRRRIEQAAYELFCERGYTGTRMADVATRAGVAVQTVYFTFHTKPDLLSAAYELAVFGEEQAPPPLQAWWGQMLAAESASELIGRFAAGTAEIMSRTAVLDEVVRSAVHEPEAVAVRRRTEELRRDGYRSVVDQLASRFGLRRELDCDRATDILLTLAGPAMYRSLVVDYEWTSEAYVDFIAGLIRTSLVG